MTRLHLKKGVWQEIGAISFTGQMSSASAICEITSGTAPVGDKDASIIIDTGVPLYFPADVEGSFYIRCITGDCAYTFSEN